MAGSTAPVRSTADWAPCGKRSSTPPPRSTARDRRWRSAAEAVQEALQSALADLETAQATEVEELAAELAAAGYPDRTQRAQLKKLEDKHKREHR